MKSAEVGKKWAESAETKESGTIVDVCELNQGDLGYKGYAVNYNEKTIYIMGVGADEFKTGDVVKVMVNPHPYGPLMSLIVTLGKK
jgi:hypothetical protein